jgi:hypothetical protein
MSDLRMVIKFKLAGDSQHRVKGAVRMKVDGRGSLLLYGGQGEVIESLQVRDLEAFSIHPVPVAAAALAA